MRQLIAVARALYKIKLKTHMLIVQKEPLVIWDHTVACRPTEVILMPLPRHIAGTHLSTPEGWKAELLRSDHAVTVFNTVYPPQVSRWHQQEQDGTLEIFWNSERKEEDMPLPDIYVTRISPLSALQSYGGVWGYVPAHFWKYWSRLSRPNLHRNSEDVV